MKLERELRHKSEDISDDVLSDTVKAHSLYRRLRPLCNLGENRKVALRM